MARGQSTTRGRGGSRGGIRGRGRGGRGGRGGRRGRTQGRFDSSRLAEVDEEVKEEPEPESELEEETEDSDSESEAEKRKKQTYQALLEGFASRTAAPASKKRKLDNGHAARAESDSEDDSEPGSDDGESQSADENQDESESGDEDEKSEDYEPKDVDFVDEEEEDHTALGRGDADDTDDDDDDEQPDPADAFETHFSAPDTEDVARRLAAIQSDAWTTAKVKANDSAQIFTTPQGAKTHVPPAPITDIGNLKLKQRIAETAAASKSPELDPVEQKVAPLLFNYYDMLFCERTPSNGDSLRRIVSIHAVNHVLKTRDRVIKHNEKLAKAARKREEMLASNEKDVLLDDAPDDEEYRDQGFTRPKVLILLPTRAACVRMVDALCAVYRPEQQENRKRFDDTYVDKSATVGADRPADYRELFDGNDDDLFRLGLKFTRKTIKYFSQFYNSDIILASPLGLRMAMGSDDRLAETVRASKAKKKPQADYDFLSSIELVLMDQAEALLMQNWEHVEHIFAHLNLRPRDSSHAFDISRLRPWYLDEQAAFYRQTVALSAFHSPVLAELFRRFCRNWAGKVRVQPAAYAGVVGRLGVRGVKQTFSRFASPAVDADPDARFDYFVKAVVPALVGKGKGGAGGRGGILVFIPSYLDFVRVRNWFATSAAVANVTFGTVSEYASTSEASRALSHFLTGRHRVLLYTERAHHFRRHQINGARTVVLYGLPENPLFYPEMTGGYLARSLASQKLEPGQGSVRAVFSQWDAFKLERVVGSARVGPMLRELSDTFVFEEEK